MRRLIVDTNVLLHFQRLDHAGWSCGVAVVFVVPPTVVSELDKQKRSTNARLQRRARGLLPWLEQNDGVKFGNGCMLILRGTEPHRTLESTPSLDRLHSDDRILATAIEILAENPEDDVCLMSDDTAPRLKARSHNVKAEAPSESLRMPPSRTDDEKERDDALRRLQAIESRAPRLSLVLSRECREFRIGPIQSGDEDGIEGRVKDEVQQLGARCTEEYIDAYAQYLRESDAVLGKIARCLRIPLVLRNDGSHHADDVQVDIEWTGPPEFLEELPEWPRRPERPRHFTNPLLPGLLSPHLELPHIDRGSPSGPHASNGETGARYRVKRIVHGTDIALDPLLLLFPSFGDARGFGLRWSIHAVHQPEAATGTLHVQISSDRPMEEFWTFLGVPSGVEEED